MNHARKPSYSGTILLRALSSAELGYVSGGEDEYGSSADYSSNDYSSSSDYGGGGGSDYSSSDYGGGGGSDYSSSDYGGGGGSDYSSSDYGGDGGYSSSDYGSGGSDGGYSSTDYDNGGSDGGYSSSDYGNGSSDGGYSSSDYDNGSTDGGYSSTDYGNGSSDGGYSSSDYDNGSSDGGYSSSDYDNGSSDGGYSSTDYDNGSTDGGYSSTDYDNGSSDGYGSADASAGEYSGNNEMESANDAHMSESSDHSSNEMEDTNDAHTSESSDHSGNNEMESLNDAHTSESNDHTPPNETESASDAHPQNPSEAEGAGAAAEPNDHVAAQPDHPETQTFDDGSTFTTHSDGTTSATESTDTAHPIESNDHTPHNEMESANEAHTQNTTEAAPDTHKDEAAEPQHPVTQKFDDGSTLTTNPDGTTSSTDKIRNDREVVNDAIDKTNRGEVLSPTERAELKSIRDTPKYTDGSVSASAYVESKSQQGALSVTNRQELKVDGDGLSHASTNSAATGGSVNVGAAQVGGEIGSENKQTTNLMTGQTKHESNGYAQGEISRGPVYGQAKVTSEGETSLTAGVRTPELKTPGGSMRAGIEGEVKVPHGNGIDREMAGRALQQSNENALFQSRGLPPSVAVNSRNPLQKLPM